MRLRPKALTRTRACAAVGLGRSISLMKREVAGPLPFLMSVFRVSWVFAFMKLQVLEDVPTARMLTIVAVFSDLKRT
jgi:hypothetical protein